MGWSHTRPRGTSLLWRFCQTGPAVKPAHHTRDIADRVSPCDPEVRCSIYRAFLRICGCHGLAKPAHPVDQLRMRFRRVCA